MRRAHAPTEMRSEGLEPPTYKFVACCSIQLSYDRIVAPRFNRATSVVTTLSRRSLPLHAPTGIDEEREGFEPSIRCYPYNDLANRRLQPLGHLSTASGFIHDSERCLLCAVWNAARETCSRVSSNSTRSARWATVSRKRSRTSPLVGAAGGEVNGMDEIVRAARIYSQTRRHARAAGESLSPLSLANRRSPVGDNCHRTRAIRSIRSAMAAAALGVRSRAAAVRSRAARAGSCKRSDTAAAMSPCLGGRSAAPRCAR